MKGSLIALGLLAIVGSVSGECNNGCSGHGRCGNDDVCTCYPMWGGADCSERKCSHRKAWGDVKDSDVTGREEHYYAECSGRGVCDSELGQCVCDEGFTGEGCDRLACPNNCNGHGTCQLMSDLNTGYDGWDKDKVMVCACDAGFTGHDCSKRKCKLGDDPITRYVDGTLEAAETQTIQLQADDALAGTFVLEYEDWRGAKWLTRPIPADSTVISEKFIEEALLSLPQRAIDSITVSLTVSSTTDITISLTFDSTETPGNQPKVLAYLTGCTTHGCQPVYGVTSTNPSVTYGGTDGTGERLECANRGKCDYETGTCICHKGFYGHACEKQTLVL